MTPVVDPFMSGQRPRYIGPELRGPADADGFRVKVGRYGDRWYHDPLPGDHIAQASDWIGPAVSIVKKASGKDWSFTALERVAKALDTEKYRNLAKWPYADRYEALKAINKIGLNSAGNRGSNVHLGFDARLHGAPCPITDDMPGADYRNAIEQFFTHYNPTLVAAEFVCIHRTLNGVGYGGTADAIIEIDGPGSQRMRFIVDWKSRGIDSDHGAYPEEAAQVAAYHGADYIIVEGRDGPERRLMPTLDGGLIVSIKPDGCRIYPVDLDKGFAHWTALHAWWVARRDEREPVGRQWPARKIVEAGDLGPVTPSASTPDVKGEAATGNGADSSRDAVPSSPSTLGTLSTGEQWVANSGVITPSYSVSFVKGTVDVLASAEAPAPFTPVSPQATQSPAAVNAGGVGSSADQPPHSPAWGEHPDDHANWKEHIAETEALAWASQPAPTPLAPLPDHPDEGANAVFPDGRIRLDDRIREFNELEAKYKALDAGSRAWITTLVTQAQQANVSFHTQGGHRTDRRYWIIKGLVDFADDDDVLYPLDDDILRALVVAALHNDAPLDTRHTPGACVGSLDAAAAQRFAALCDDYVGTPV